MLSVVIRGEDVGGAAQDEPSNKAATVMSARKFTMPTWLNHVAATRNQLFRSIGHACHDALDCVGLLADPAEEPKQ